jgi:cytochrome P450
MPLYTNKLSVTFNNLKILITKKLCLGIARDPFVYLFPAYTKIPSKMIPYRNRARLANERLRKILIDIISERKQSLENKSPMDNHKQDLLTLMIAAAKEGHGNPNYLTDGELVSNLAVFFVAGHETTAGATASFMYYLAVNPEIQDKARQEVLSVLGDAPEDVIPLDTELNQMTYLNDCIRETMRINPPTSGNIPRIVTEDTNFGGYFIPKSTTVGIVSKGTHTYTQNIDMFVGSL